MKRYTIGDVADRLGISRDTLRFYEKKGMIRPEKQENGYRYYSYEDTRTLLDILFYRRLNFSIRDIDRILHRSSYGSYYAMIQEKIKEEMHLVQKHRQSLIYLQYLEQLYKNIGAYLNKYDLRPLRRYYMLDDAVIDQLHIFDLCFIYQEYAVTESSLSQTDEYYLFAADTAAILGMEQKLADHLFIQHERCVYTVVTSDSRIPKEQSIREAAVWARHQGYDLVGTAYSGYLLSCAVEEETQESAPFDPDVKRELASQPACCASPRALPSDGRNAKTDRPSQKSGPVCYIELYLPLVQRGQSQ